MLTSTFKPKPSCSTGLDVIKYLTCNNTDSKQYLIYFFIFFLIISSSCARILHPVVTDKKQQNNPQPNTTSNTSTHNNGGKFKQYNPENFTSTLIKDIVYSTAKNLRQARQQLGMDVYKPANAEGKKFPLILLIHGGNFKTGDKTDLATVCAALASNGYVCVSINYRVGWGTGLPRNTCNADTQQLKQAVYMAVQDAHAAMHYIVAHADEYSVDKNWMFIGGHSAGAITALFTAFLSQKNADDFFESIASVSGKLDAGSDNSKTNYKFRGVLSMWGAFIDPQLITASTALPVIFFQGMQDPLVPFNSAHITPCKTTSLLYGTYPLYNRLKELDETVIAHVDVNGGHGVFSNDFRIKNILCFLNYVRKEIKKQEYITGEQDSCN